MWLHELVELQPWDNQELNKGNHTEDTITCESALSGTIK